ncbi:Septum formation initiator [Pseudoruegeria aquimaris]|uniref:Septum formation initiator n=1 Tax=Pseudoruegeria aquimaris TaxID=393663 RepID=A0A1Y5RNL9_9RHOB|nr:septum formation initiator family protein [Pseudoruegeria aquimaris]SLN21833.1 Septum formation initiator [Pseudoruegeria aquimaris]
MTSTPKRISLLSVTLYGVVFILGSMFMISAIQGEYGVFRRVQIEAEAELLRSELDALSAEVAAYENKTRRLSDAYLDLDLLDQQARDVLGYVRSDEIVIR